MITSDVLIHDQFDFEVNFVYDFNGKVANTNRYKIETYLFLPKSLSIHRHNFFKNDFYRSIKNFIRLTTSRVLLEDFNNLAQDYFGEINRCITLYQGNPTRENLDLVSQSMKIFCCTFEGSLEKRRRFAISNRQHPEIEKTLFDFLQQSTSIVQGFRVIEEKIRSPEFPTLIKLYRLIDEYLSYIIYNNFFRILLVFQRNPRSPLCDQFISFLKSEINHRRRYNYLLPDKESENEEFIYRNKVILKKPIWGILHLDLEKREDGSLKNHFILSLAAGISMVIATVIAFFFQYHYGNFTLPFFVAMVGGYMVKDRVKESLRSRLASQISSHRPDHLTKIFSHNNKVIGRLSEGFHFISKKFVPIDVLELREKDRIENIHRHDNYDEHVIYYEKKVHLNEENFKTSYNRLYAEGIKDMIRFNVTPFTLRMDNPIHYSHTLNEENEEVELVKCLRVYHINLVIKATNQNQTILERYRIVLNRNGIRKIVKVEGT